MDAVLTSLAPAAPAAPARGIGSAVRTCGAAESEAAAGFAAILAAVPATTATVAAAPVGQANGSGATIAETMGAESMGAETMGAATTGDATMGDTAPGDAAAVEPAAPAANVAAPAPAFPPAADAEAATQTAIDITGTAGEAVADIPSAGGQPAQAAIPATVALAFNETDAAPGGTAAVVVPAAALPPTAAAGASGADAPIAPPADLSVGIAETVPAPTTPVTSSVPAAAIAPAQVQVLTSTPAPAPAAGTTVPAANVATTAPAVAADPEIPASAAAPLSVAAALDAASPAVAVSAAETEAKAVAGTGKSVEAKNDAGESEETDGAAALPVDAEPASNGPTAAEQALLGVGLHTYLKTAGPSTLRAAVVAPPQAATNGDPGAATGRPAAFAALVNDFLAADVAATTGDGLGVRIAGDLSDPATVAHLRAQAGGASAASIRSQVAEQVSRGLLAGKGEEKLTIRLNPEELGQVDVDLRAVNDRLTVTLRAGTPEAEQALRSGARELTDSIIERSGRFQHVEVRVESRDGGTIRADKPEDRQQDQKQDGKQQDGRRDGRGETRGHQTDDADAAREAWVRAFTDLSQPSQEA